MDLTIGPVGRAVVALYGLIFVSACSTYGPVLESECAASGAPILTQRIEPSLHETTVNVRSKNPKAVCIELAVKPHRTDDDRAVDVESISMRTGFEGAVSSILGGGRLEQSERLVPAATGGRVQMLASPQSWLQAGGRSQLDISIGGRDRDAWIRVYDIPDLNLPPDDPPGDGDFVVGFDIPEFSCNGRLKGFDDSLLFADAPPRRNIERSGVHVYCEAKWAVPGKSRPVTLTTASVQTDEEGQFTATFLPTQFVSRLTVARPRLLEITAVCVPPLCGKEAIRPPFVVGVDYEAVADAYTVDVLNVLDMVTPGHASDGYFLGARLISSANEHPELNDKPFIVHEQLDVLGVERTSFLAWGFAGQPMRRSFENNVGEVFNIDPDTQPCEIDVEEQICLPFTEACNPRQCLDVDSNGNSTSNGNTRCLEYPMLQAMVDAGYDLWLVDHLRGDEDITHTVAGVPLLYQLIANYGGPLLGPLPTIVPYPLPDPRTFEMADVDITPQSPNGIYVPSDILNRVEQEMLAELPSTTVPPDPQRGNRKLIVSGYSLGGVIARMGLRYWQLIRNFGGIRDASGSQLIPALDSRVLMEPVDDVVALYVSIDAPHRGVTVPPALQAYLLRLGSFLDSATSIELTFEQQQMINNAIRELDSLPVRQSTPIHASLKADESLNCFTENGLKIFFGSNDCTIEPSDISDRVDSTTWNAFSATWLQGINQREPESTAGMPADIPAIAVSNGAAQTGRPLDTREIAHVVFNINNSSDLNHRLRDVEPQPSGSQWNNICRRLRTVDLDGGKVREVRVNYPMRKRFSDSGAPEAESGFPTLVPIQSAFNSGGTQTNIWLDQVWQGNSEYHTNIDNRVCATVLFYADGVHDETHTGPLVCRPHSPSASCLDGGRRPGNRGEAQISSLCNIVP